MIAVIIFDLQQQNNHTSQLIICINKSPVPGGSPKEAREGSRFMKKKIEFKEVLSLKISSCQRVKINQNFNTLLSHWWTFKFD